MAVGVALAALVGMGDARAQVPNTMNFQGLLLDAAGEPKNGTVLLIFTLHSTETGGGALWSEIHSNVPVTDGIYDVNLGGTNPLTAAVFSSATRYLQISVDGEVLLPRRQLLVVPYAIRAEAADTANTATNAATADTATNATNATTAATADFATNAGHATTADSATTATTAGTATSATTALNVGGISASFVDQVYQHTDFDDNGTLNSDPTEGLGDVDADGLANFIDPDNDGDGISDATEIAQGTNPNLVSPTLTGFSPTSLLESTAGSVTIIGTNFDLLQNVQVTFSGQGVQVTNVTPTNIVVNLGPQSPGVKLVAISSSNGSQVTGNFPIGRRITVFVTSVPFNGALGGLSGADQRCQTRAGAAGLPGQFLAWIRTAANATRTADRWLPGSVFEFVGGAQFASSYSDLVTYTAGDTLLDKSEFGNSVSGSAWTGGGSVGGNSYCSDWLSGSAAATGTSGVVGGTTDWQSGAETQCSMLLRLYCFEN
jgi:hypothetical protein